jgi:hypothetical protein
LTSSEGKGSWSHSSCAYVRDDAGFCATAAAADADDADADADAGFRFSGGGTVVGPLASRASAGAVRPAQELALAAAAAAAAAAVVAAAVAAVVVAAGAW